MPNSENEQSIPSDGWPRNLVFLILKSPGNTAPSVAHATFKPKRQFGAPHTISNKRSPPTFTFVTRNLSASGCCAHSTTSPITTPVNAPATGSTPSTSKPNIVIWSHSCSVEIAGFTHSRNQDSLNFILYPFQFCKIFAEFYRLYMINIVIKSPRPLFSKEGDQII